MLPAGSLMPDNLVPQVGGWGMRLTSSETVDGTKHIRQGREKEVRIGTCNVLALYKGGALKQLEKVLQDYEIDVIALQEANMKRMWIYRELKYEALNN
jgi:hypothetical protein